MTTTNNPLAELINIAAGLVRGDFCPSPHREDYQRHVPRWMLGEIGHHQDGHKVLGMRIKAAVDKLKEREGK
jgi:hypothetical protein